jgi:hypothetical protein
MKLPEELAAELLVDNGHYNDFLLGKAIAEDKLSQDIADAIRLAYLEGVEDGTIAEID